MLRPLPCRAGGGRPRTPPCPHMRAGPGSHGATCRGPVTSARTDADIGATRACLSTCAQASPGRQPCARVHSTLGREGAGSLLPSLWRTVSLSEQTAPRSPASAGADGDMSYRMVAAAAPGLRFLICPWQQGLPELGSRRGPEGEAACSPLPAEMDVAAWRGGSWPGGEMEVRELPAGNLLKNPAFGGRAPESPHNPGCDIK